MDKTTIENIIAITERLPTDGHALRQEDMADVMSRSQWNVCYEWLAANAKRYILSGSDMLTAISEVSRKNFLEQLHLIHKDIERAEHDRNLNNKVLEDTLHNNKVTRKIAVCSLIVSIAALIVSIAIPCCSHSSDSPGEQQRRRNDSTLAMSASVLSYPEYVDTAPNRAKSAMLISDSIRSTRLICATLISSKSIVAVSSSILPLSLKL